MGWNGSREPSCGSVNWASPQSCRQRQRLSPIYRSHSCTSYVPGILKTYTSEFGLRTRRNVWENVSDAPAD
ncbi:hypothetical protein EMCRGX_G005993 [Ephydatia muelleri]